MKLQSVRKTLDHSGSSKPKWNSWNQDRVATIDRSGWVQNPSCIRNKCIFFKGITAWWKKLFRGICWNLNGYLCVCLIQYPRRPYYTMSHLTDHCGIWSRRGQFKMWLFSSFIDLWLKREFIKVTTHIIYCF